MHGSIYRTAEEVSELQSEDTDVGGKKNTREDRDVLCKLNPPVGVLQKQLN